MAIKQYIMSNRKKLFFSNNIIIILARETCQIFALKLEVEFVRFNVNARYSPYTVTQVASLR